MEGTIRRLHELGFAVDEVALQPTGDGETKLRLHVAVGDRRYHAAHLRGLTGLDVGEGQARILLGDLHAYQVHLCRESGEDVGEPTAAQLWLREVAMPGMDRAHSAVAAQRLRRSRRTAICWRSAGCSASRRATMSAPRKPLRR